MLLPNELHLVQSINKLLLVGYYLLNLGYTAFTLSFWKQIDSFAGMCDVLFKNAGTIIICLALMHYFNLIWILIYSRSHNKSAIAGKNNT